MNVSNWWMLFIWLSTGCVLLVLVKLDKILFKIGFWRPFHEAGLFLVDALFGEVGKEKGGLRVFLYLVPSFFIAGFLFKKLIEPLLR